MISYNELVNRIESMTMKEQEILFHITGSDGMSVEDLAMSLSKWDWNTGIARDMMCKLYAFKD